MRTANIIITDHNDGVTCTSFYGIRIKQTADSAWTVLPNQYGTLGGSPAAYYVTIEPMVDDTSYDYEITRHCCNGSISVAATGYFNSGV